MTELILVVLIDVLCLGLKVQTWTIRAWTFLTDSATPGVKVPKLWFFGGGGLGVGKIIFCVCLTITDSIDATDDTCNFFFLLSNTGIFVWDDLYFPTWLLGYVAWKGEKEESREETPVKKYQRLNCEVSFSLGWGVAQW